MTVTGLKALDTTIEKTNIWLEEIPVASLSNMIKRASCNISATTSATNPIWMQTAWPDLYSKSFLNELTKERSGK
jgi:hypothetical protein